MMRKLGAILVVLFLVLLAGNGISGKYSDTVIIPLVEENGNTGIPITKHINFVAITLIDPRGREIHIPMRPDPDRVDATLIDGTSIRHLTIVLQDWPQSGDVIPLSQDWPQDAELRFRIQDWPHRTSLSIIVPQDWPQGQIPGILR